MNTNQNTTNRREFFKTAALTGAALAAAGPLLAQEAEPKKPKLKLGLDNYSVNRLKMKAPALIDYAASLKTDSLFITDFGPFEKTDDAYLRDIKHMAADKGLKIQLGSWSICPTSRSFRKDWGTAEEHLATGLRMAKALGSPVFRVVLGTADDRKTNGGIEARIEDTVKVCKALKNLAQDTGVKIAVENHAGDMHSTELVTLIEAAGKDYVGANMDSGNACWTMEDPMQTLETLAPYVLTTSLRDAMIWESPNGAMVQWTAMGEGGMDLKKYFARFTELCPNVPVHIETISGFAKEIAFMKPDVWKLYPKMRAADFAKFLMLAKKGKAITVQKPASEEAYQKGEIERSIKYCQEQLGLGQKA